MASGGATVYVDYAARGDVPAMVIGGMTVAERVLREAARSGAAKAIIRGDALPTLPALPLAVETIPSTAEPPPDAAAIDGDVVAGVRISDAATRKEAARALFRTCRRPYDGLGDKYVVRYLSIPLTRVLVKLPITPNQITTANIAVGVSACVLALQGTRLSLAIAGALLVLQLVLDSCDGEVARIRHLHSRFGMALDNISDDIMDNTFVAILGLALGGAWAPIGIAAACARGFSAAMIYVDVARRGKFGDVMAFKWFFDSADEQLAERFDARMSLTGLVRSIGRRDLYVLIFAASCIAGVPLVGLLVGVANSAVYFVLAVAHLIITSRR